MHLQERSRCSRYNVVASKSSCTPRHDAARLRAAIAHRAHIVPLHPHPYQSTLSRRERTRGSAVEALVSNTQLVSVCRVRAVRAVEVEEGQLRLH
eukprot:6214632-Pleurochrysis_carterae.AAC.2